jgi:hypothetical protein
VDAVIDEAMNSEAGRWIHLEQYTKKYLKQEIVAYDEIAQMIDDITIIANCYQVMPQEVMRAKDYAFGSGVSKYRFIPDMDMAMAWKRMAAGKGTAIDEVLLRHEIFESDLVINKGMNQKAAHELAQAKYPWSELLSKN